MCRWLILILTMSCASSLNAIAGVHTVPTLGNRDWVRLPGHVLSALEKAERIESLGVPGKIDEPLTITLVLKREDQAGFDHYLQNVYNPKSKIFRRFLSQKELTRRFGPSLKAYDSVVGYLRKNGFELIQGSENRLTLTVTGRRLQAEQAFALNINDYALGRDRKFYANDRDPALPRELYRYVGSISGLSNLSIAKSPIKQTTPTDVKNRCRDDALGLIPGVSLFQAYLHQGQGGNHGDVNADIMDFVSVITAISYVWNKLFTFQIVGGYTLGDCAGYYLGYALAHHDFALANGANSYRDFLLKALASVIRPADAAENLVNPQKIGILSFDTFHISDVENWLRLLQIDPSVANQVSEVSVNGGNGSPGVGESEVLLDIGMAIIADPSPNVSYVVYSAPLHTSFQQLFNSMINDGVTVISNSWSQCEDQTSLAEAQGIDGVLAQAAAGGISVLNASGDTGSTCLDGKINTIGVPADSPHATAVGGTTPTLGLGYTYGTEHWWDGSNGMPPTGQGGFGVSRFFSRPAYQNGLTLSVMRSVPDMVSIADPQAGIQICQASAGGCPSGLLYGGTSMAAPAMAGMVAFLNEALGTNVGELNPVIYPLAGTPAFHSAAGMGSDFSHVGLGSPHLNYLKLALSRQTIGPPSPSASIVAISNAVADGESTALVQVNLVDGNGYPVVGKALALTPVGSSHAVISSTSGLSDQNDGAVVFQLTDEFAETVNFSVTDVTDNVTLSHMATVSFAVPSAAAASFNAFPTEVTADGVSTSTITLTLQDALGRPTPGKLIKLEQTGSSVITGPVPPITDGNGQIQFTVVDQLAETVTYTATDVSDGDLAFPASGTVSFINGIANGCGNGNPVPMPGFLFTPYATGFVAQNYFFGNVNFGGCPGAGGMAFDHTGNLYVGHGPTGNIYKFPPGGGVADASTLLTSTAIGPSLGALVIDPSGRLFAGRAATTGNFNSGVVLEIDPANGSILREIASGLTCSGFIARDPLSGDLFVDDSCAGAGSDNPSIWRIADPSGPAPSTSVYATMAGTPNATLSFSPSGALYVWTVTATGAQVAKVSGTNGPSTPTIDLLPGLLVGDLALLADGVPENGNTDTLLFNFPAGEHSPGGIGRADLNAVPPSYGVRFTTKDTPTVNLVKGPDGCLYSAKGTTVFRITDEAGTCDYASAPPEPALVLEAPNAPAAPVQGASQNLSVRLHFADVPEGTPLFFNVIGANPQTKMVRADANGQAAFDYTAVHAGKDVIEASINVNDVLLQSNSVALTWANGAHATFLSLNSTPVSGTQSKQTTVAATLTDISAQPAVALANETIQFTLGNGNCSAETDDNGRASCKILLGQTGIDTLSAHFAGNEQLLASNASVGFTVTKRVNNRGRNEALDGRRPTAHRLQPCRLRHPTHCRE